MKWTTVVPAVLAFVKEAFASDPVDGVSRNGCNIACQKLSFLLPDRVALQNSPAYELGNSNYWSARQTALKPACRVTPNSALDVSITLTTLEINNCQFALKSGGHASFAGASNIGGSGVTIDLRNLDQIVVSKDRKQVAVGAGVLWSTLYKNLDVKHLSVVGGRSGDIGVGGLTLGGGISFFSGKYGWACDNVVNYQVVLADGSVRNVNERSNPDLYFALRGGGNNFGIVTRFDLASFEQGKMWGGQVVHTGDKGVALYNALYNFNINHEKDPRAAVIVATAFMSALNTSLYSVSLEHSEPLSNPPILDNFTSIPHLQSSSRITNLTDLTLELNATQPPGLRETFWTFTFRNDVQLMTDIEAIFTSQLPSILNAPGLLPALVLQPLSTAITSHFTSRGGNALGITPKTGPLIIVNLSIAWKNEEDDERILKFATDVVNKGVALSKERGLAHEYIYQNYATEKQDVFPGYGAANLARLKRIQKKYDPARVFTRLQPGYFKIRE